MEGLHSRAACVRGEAVTVAPSSSRCSPARPLRPRPRTGRRGGSGLEDSAGLGLRGLTAGSRHAPSRQTSRVRFTTRAVTGELSKSSRGGNGEETAGVPAWHHSNPLQRLLPPVIHFTNDRSLLTAENVLRLWDATLQLPERDRDLTKVQRAIDHSFAVQMAVVFDRGGLRQEDPPKVHLVGLTRAMSDGAFVATICDVAVAPEHQRRGVGRKLVRALVSDMRNNGPSSFAVFPKPKDREFFSKCGFGLSHRFMMMKYMEREGGDRRSELVGVEGVELEAPQLRSTLGGLLLAADGEPTDILRDLVLPADIADVPLPARCRPTVEEEAEVMAALAPATAAATSAALSGETGRERAAVRAAELAAKVRTR